MRWIRFTAEGRTAYGILEGDRIAEVAGDPFRGHEATSRRHDLSAVKIEVPVIPPTFYCAGLNYVEHVKEGAAKRGEVPNIPTKPDMGYRAANALIAHGETIVIPADATEKVHYEGELVAVVGKKAKHLTEENALDCLLGWTIGNDVSERTWQKADRTFWRSKNTDTFKPMGPWIETDFDLDAAETIVRLNGEITHPLPHQPHAVRRREVHGDHDAQRHAASGRHHLVGHGWLIARPQAWRRGGYRDHRPRPPDQPRHPRRRLNP